MFERFTDGARQVIVLAQEEARMLYHNYIGTEHLLLALIHEGEGVAAKALESMDIALEAALQQVEDIIGRGQAPPTGHIPFTPRAKNVLELSLREALRLGHSHIGTEHLLLGLVREGEGVGARILQDLGADMNRVGQAVIELLPGDSSGMSFERQTREELRRVLDLPPLFEEREKAVLTLLTREGLTTSAIAEELGVSKEQVGEIIRAIVAKLGEILQEDD